MYRYDNNNIITGYIKELLHSFNLPKPKVYKNVLSPSLKLIASLASNLIAKLSTTLNLTPKPAWPNPSSLASFASLLRSWYPAPAKA